MPLLQVKDFPAETYERLREYAAQEHRSISQQTIHIIERDLNLRASAVPAYSMHVEPSRFPDADNRREAAGYLAKRKRLFAEIDEMRAVPVTESCPSTADLLAAAREEDAE